jgi:UDP-glucose 4-epimerase
LIETLNQLLGTKITPVHAAPRVGDVRESLADITQARSRLGYEPKVSLAEGLRRFVEWYKQYGHLYTLPGEG